MNSRSRARGGSALLGASLLLILATLCETPSLNEPSGRDGVFWVFVVSLILASIGYLAAALLLAAGPRAMVAGSAAARVGLVSFGVLWLIAEVLYLFGVYFTPSDSLTLTSTVLSILMLVGGLIAAIAIGVRSLVSGAGRWILLVGVVVSGITGGIASGSDSTAVVTVLRILSSVAFAVVGLVYLVAPSRARATVDAR